MNVTSARTACMFGFSLTPQRGTARGHTMSGISMSSHSFPFSHFQSSRCNWSEMYLNRFECIIISHLETAQWLD